MQYAHVYLPALHHELVDFPGATRGRRETMLAVHQPYGLLGEIEMKIITPTSNQLFMQMPSPVD